MTSEPSFNYQTLPYKKSREKLINQNNDWLNRHQCEFQLTKPEKQKKTNQALIQKKEMKDIKACNSC